MKYKTFILVRNLGAAGLATLAAVGAFIGCRSKNNDAPQVGNYPTTPTTVTAPPKMGTTSPKMSTGKTPTKPAPVAPTAATTALTANDKEVMRLQKQPLSNGKTSGDSTKWVATSNAFKAEFRADAGASAWNRVKLDYDGDKKWDERWDFKDDGSIKRRVAPQDDENYSVEYKLKSSSDSTWIRAK